MMTPDGSAWPLLPYVVAFAAMFAMDYCYARYTIAITKNRVHPANGWAAGITVFNSLVVLAYVNTPAAIACAAAGAYCGTWLALRMKKPQGA